MLVKKPFQENDVISIKLIGGEELITCLISESDEILKISKPYLITIVGTKVGMMPWMVFSENDLHTIKKSHIISFTLSKSLAAKEYLEKTTGLTLGV